MSIQSQAVEATAYCITAPIPAVTWKSKYVAELDQKRKAGDFEASGEVVIEKRPSK